MFKILGLSLKAWLVVAIMSIIITILGFSIYIVLGWYDAVKNELAQSQVNLALSIQATNEDIAIIKQNSERKYDASRISTQPKGNYEIILINGN